MPVSYFTSTETFLKYVFPVIRPVAFELYTTSAVHDSVYFISPPGRSLLVVIIRRRYEYTFFFLNAFNREYSYKSCERVLNVF